MVQILENEYNVQKNFIKFNLNNMGIDINNYSKNNILNTFSIGAISNNIMQIGFNEIKILLFLVSNPISLIQIFENSNESAKNYDYLNSIFPNRMKIIYGKINRTVVDYICNNFEKFDLIHLNNKNNNYEAVRLDILNCYYLSNKKTLILYEKLQGLLHDLIDQKIIYKARTNDYLLDTENKQLLLKYNNIL
jgi:hypothetical protein